MAEAKEIETTAPECPFAREWVMAATRVFLANRAWRRIYDAAPPGAKRRLEVSFWFSQNRPADMDDDGTKYSMYRTWREDVERSMTEEDLEYMIKVIDKPGAQDHYASLLKGRRPKAHANTSGVALMSYDDFFALLDELGEFKSFDYPDDTKAAIISDFLPVLEGSGDPLEAHVEDILATAKLKEVRVYPKDETMYVRVEVRFLTETAQWSAPYQMVAAWSCFNELMGYAFPVGKGRRSRLPIELENPENALQREKRMALKALRTTTMGKANQ